MLRILHRLSRRATVIGVLLMLTVLGSAWGRELPGQESLPVTADGKLLASSDSGAAILRANDLFPGASRHGSVTITNDGERIPQLDLRTSVRDAPGALGGRLSQALVLRVDEIDAAGEAHELWTGRLAAIPAIRQRGLIAGEHRTFRLTVTLPRDASNDVQGSAATLNMRWSG